MKSHWMEYMQYHCLFDAANFVFVVIHTEPRSIIAFIGVCASFITLFPAKIAVDIVFEGKGNKDIE